MPHAATQAQAGSAVAPLRRRVFFWLFAANVASNIGSAIHDVGAGWLMTTLSPSPVMVSLVQAAAAFPLFLFALPAGALADVADRRRLLLAAQTLMGLAAAALGASVLLGDGHIPPVALLLLTLALGTGAALANPAWQTAMTDLVPREELPAAASLNSVSMNVSRAVGPAIGGLIVAALGAAAAFLFNAASFLGIIGALALWRYRRETPTAPPETLAGAMRAGVRYMAHSPPVRAVLVRTASFAFPASCLWALMPLVARDELGLRAAGYGLLLSCLGAGAVAATAVLPRLRARWSPNGLVVGATALYALMLATLALASGPLLPAIACAAMGLAGVAWVTMVTSLNVGAQTGVPSWVRARALACYLTVFYGGMAAGSAVWGFVAAHGAIAGLSGVRTALLAASGGMVLGLMTIAGFRLHEGLGEAHEYDRHWADPRGGAGISPGAGPVAVTVEYIIDAPDFAPFARAMDLVRRTRQRDGARTWVLTQDTADPRRWVEIFIVGSWGEHLRQHQRVTRADRVIQDRAKAFHRGEGPPRVSHLVAPGLSPLSVGAARDESAAGLHGAPK
jgi:predicted MFS family arabinose efflux permease